MMDFNTDMHSSVGADGTRKVFVMVKDLSFEFIVDIDESSILDKMHIWDVYLNIVGRLQIKVNNNLILLDEVHPVVELAVLLQRWLDNDYCRGVNFEYFSLEDEEQTLWFRKVVGGFEIGSNLHSNTIKLSIKSAI